MINRCMTINKIQQNRVKGKVSIIFYIFQQLVMLNKILGKKQKTLDFFHVPDRKYCHDAKKLNKMQKKELLDEIDHMEKYISTICTKLDEGKKQYQKSLDRLEQSTEKLNVVNSKMAMITNEHQQLQVKLLNLSNSLEIMTKQKQSILKTELKFLQSKQLSKNKINDLSAILTIYHDQVLLVDKIAYQNKNLKQKYSQLETDFFALSDKINESKSKGHNQDNIEGNHSGKQIQETQPDDEKNNQYKLLMETKQQMVVLLNKKINEQKDKILENQEKISDLNHQIACRQAEIRQKDQDINRYSIQISQSKRKNIELKQFQNQLLKEQQILKQQVKKQAVQIQKLKNQINQLNYRLNYCQHQNKILAGNQNKLLQQQNDEQKYFELQKAKLSHQIEKKDNQITILKQKMNQLVALIAKKEESLSQMTIKIQELENVQQMLAEETKQKLELTKKLEDQQQNYQIKLKKLQFSLNQERIKSDTLKRSLTNLQVKQQQNRKQLDQMYEQKVVNDNKVAKMEGKLKNYKQMIQYLQKQKVEMQKTMENKIRNMQEIVIHDVEEEQHQSEISERDIVQKQQAIITKLNSKIVDLQEQIQFLKQENRALNNQKGELEVSNLELQKNVKTINEKRQQMIKQFSKMGSLDLGVVNRKNAEQTKLNMPQNREKKVAEKALKGFDIISKNLSSLYKEFLNVHISDIQKKAIKDMEGNINSLVGKCEDMKDIFQGYL